MEKTLAEAKRKAQEDAIMIINEQEDSSEVSRDTQHRRDTEHNLERFWLKIQQNLRPWGIYFNISQCRVAIRRRENCQVSVHARISMIASALVRGRGRDGDSYNAVMDSNLMLLHFPFLSVAGTAVVKPVRHAAVATPLATAAPSASIKTGRGITSSAAQDFRLSPNLCRPSLQAEQQQQLGCLLWVWLGSRPQTAFHLSPALVERRQRSLLARPLRPPQLQPPKPTDTRRQRTCDVNRRASLGLYWQSTAGGTNIQDELGFLSPPLAH